MEYSSHAALDLIARQPKAEKIRRLLPLPATQTVLSLLEVGTGAGAIAHHFSKLSEPAFKVFAIDVQDQRRIREGYEFQVYDGESLPFDSETFDVVISNHVIEHVGNQAQQARHLNEICRVLAPGGYSYLATPSRWQLVEPHFSLPFLSWIPRSWRDNYVRAMGRGVRYDCNPLRPVELWRLLKATGIPCQNLFPQAVRELAALEQSRNVILRIAANLPVSRLNTLRNFSPTLIYLIHKPGHAINRCGVQN